MTSEQAPFLRFCLSLLAVRLDSDREQAGSGDLEANRAIALAVRQCGSPAVTGISWMRPSERSFETVALAALPFSFPGRTTSWSSCWAAEDRRTSWVSVSWGLVMALVLERWRRPRAVTVASPASAHRRGGLEPGTTPSPTMHACRAPRSERNSSYYHCVFACMYARQITRLDGSAIDVTTEASILSVNKRPGLAVQIFSSN